MQAFSANESKYLRAKKLIALALDICLFKVMVNRKAKENSQKKF